MTLCLNHINRSHTTPKAAPRKRAWRRHRVGSSDGSMENVDFGKHFGACRQIQEYKKLECIGEGTYGVVFKALDTKTNQIVALKQVRIIDGNTNGFPVTALREIRLLTSLSRQNSNIVALLDVAVGPSLEEIYIVFEYIDHDMAELLDSPIMKSKPFSIAEVKCLLQQLFTAVAHLHSSWIIHRDIKMSNLLYSNKGVLKLADFGLARQFSQSSSLGSESMTPRVVTLWYRAPELLLFGSSDYDIAVDIWSCGCIMAELLLGRPLLPGDNELDQLGRMFRLLGTPNDKIWPGFSARAATVKFLVTFPPQPYSDLRAAFPDLSLEGFDLLNRMLTYDPKKRISIHEALAHPFFRERPLARPVELMPTFPALPRGMRTREREKHDRAPVVAPEGDVNAAEDEVTALLNSRIANVFG